MIHWGKLDKNSKLTDVAAVVVTDKVVALSAALESYSKADGVQYPSQVKLWCKKILSLIDRRKSIHTITVDDANKVFEHINKNENEATAYRARATLLNAIRYAYTGEMPEVKAPIPRNGNGEVEDVGKLKFSKAKISEIVSLIPLYNTTGRFGWVKAEVQKQIYSLEPGEAGVIEAPKRSMTDKEAKALIWSVQVMLDRAALPWTIKWNSNDSVFIIIRKSDFSNLFPKKGKDQKAKGKVANAE